MPSRLRRALESTLTTSRLPSEPTSFTSPVIDYEPAPEPMGRPQPPQLGVIPVLNVAGPAAPCPPPSPAALHRHTPRPLAPVAPHRVVREPLPPRAAVVFADAALRRVLEVIDRRRPIAQLRPLLTPALIDRVVRAAASRGHRGGGVAPGAAARRVDGDGSPTAAEVFATYTRGRRVRAIAARIEKSAMIAGGWWPCRSDETASLARLCVQGNTVSVERVIKAPAARDLCVNRRRRKAFQLRRVGDGGPHLGDSRLSRWSWARSSRCGCGAGRSRFSCRTR